MAERCPNCDRLRPTDEVPRWARPDVGGYERLCVPCQLDLVPERWSNEPKIPVAGNR